ncbi:MAG: carboxypeptidase regulatory-like domain-containing protein [Deltaproteobacteria bacterium]|nr:carboxypeptidase regulatory-like domain-containing protein [Deltaproteobacteria bacterium]
MRRLCALAALVLASCASTEEDEHRDLPEANLPTHASSEVGPVAEIILGPAEISRFSSTPDGLESAPIELPAAASRVSMLLLLDPTVPMPHVFVAPGWSNGLLGPFKELPEVWREGDARVLALDLDTVATRIRLRLSSAEAPGVRRLQLVANVPLDAAVRATPVSDASPEEGSLVAPRSAWGALPARCGENDGAPSSVRLRRLPGPLAGQDTGAYLRALQALALHGREWCDLEVDLVVTSDRTFLARGSRRVPKDGPSDTPESRIELAILGCEQSSALESTLDTTLDELAARYGLDSSEQLVVGASSCPGNVAEWVPATVDAWRTSRANPPTQEELVEGTVADPAGAPLGGSTVTCSCGVEVTADPSGAWSMTLPIGTHPLTASKPGFVPSSTLVQLDGIGTTRLPIVLSPEVTPPTEGEITGVVYDSDSGDEISGTPIANAVVSCACGRSATSDASGRFSLRLPIGTVSLSVTANGFQPRSLNVEVTAGSRFVPVPLTPDVPSNPLVSVIDHAFLITRFGGVNADPFRFAETQDGFQEYLDAVGVTYFAAWEYVVPNNQAVATDCGYSILLPDRSMWPKAAALGLLADQLRALVNEPVQLRNWWRPPCYNEGVGGEPNGDHPDGDALDLDFRSNRSRADAQRLLCETYWSRDIVQPEEIAPGSNLNPRLNLSVGLGGITIHVGVLSANGRRFWKYSSYTEEPNSGSCW